MECMGGSITDSAIKTMAENVVAGGAIGSAVGGGFGVIAGLGADIGSGGTTAGTWTSTGAKLGAAIGAYLGSTIIMAFSTDEFARCYKKHVAKENRSWPL